MRKHWEEIQKTIGAIDRRNDFIFRCAVPELLQHGMDIMADDETVANALAEIDAEHDEAERNGKHLWIGRDFEKAIVKCEHELSKFSPNDLITYINQGMEYDIGGKTREQMRLDVSNLIAMYFDGAYEIDSVRELVESAGLDEDDMEFYGCQWVYPEDEDEDRKGIFK